MDEYQSKRKTVQKGRYQETGKNGLIEEEHRGKKKRLALSSKREVDKKIWNAEEKLNPIEENRE